MEEDYNGGSYLPPAGGSAYLLIDVSYLPAGYLHTLWPQIFLYLYSSISVCQNAVRATNKCVTLKVGNGC